MGKYEANDTGVSVKIKWNKLTRTSMGEKATIRISKLQKKVVDAALEKMGID
eukprot:CAMPEP_0114317254 /NCGR_PEP_ID=MMETSP0059-20121206/23768_1 /TAXON_ID=36894 /ORGANISM="Pyramimonas parkeae, Strain CCMP726" /LENGTH=51 /DNA_ID=CAMNT_0001443499 /DNA_START=22 /DNA_END=174 /DNA_ORIENTATION=+